MTVEYVYLWLFANMTCIYTYVSDYAWKYVYMYRMQEKYEQLKTDTTVQVGSETDDHLFFKACRGWSDKGTIYGLGREGPSMFERPTKVRRVVQVLHLKTLRL